jgi:flagellum-specific peptidoglycan hydrolase FlgJ
MERQFGGLVLMLFIGIGFGYTNFIGSETKEPGQPEPENMGVVQLGQTKSSSDEEEDEQLSFALSFTDKQAQDFITRFKEVAKQEQTAYKIPASITLAQGLLESTAGLSRLASECNNLFGIKCFSKSCSKGHCKNFTDDSHKDFFRNFDGFWSSFREHSNLLQKSRYKDCYTCKSAVCWTKELKKAGYATDKRYPQKLQFLIRKFNLTQYD